MNRSVIDSMKDYMYGILGNIKTNTIPRATVWFYLEDAFMAGYKKGLEDTAKKKPSIHEFNGN